MTVTLLMSSDIPNLNGRIYPKELLYKIADQINNGQPLYGEFGYPDKYDAVVNLSNASHVITKAYVDGDSLKAEVSILETFKGVELKKELDKNVFRPRGIGTVDENGIMNDDYQLITFDAIKTEDDAFDNIINIK